MALAAVTQILLDRLGWQWAMRCLGLGAGSLSLLCSYFIKVRTAPAAQLAILSHFRKNKRNSISAASGGPPKPQPPPLDFAVFRNSKFIVLFFIGFTAMWVNNIPFQFGPLFATQAVGVSASTASLVLSIMNGCSSFGRIAWGFTSDRIGSQNVLFVASFFCFASILALWIPCGTGTVSLLFAFAVAYGFCAGALFSMLPTVLATTVGTEGFAGKIGMLYLSFAPGGLAGPPVAGLSLEKSSSFLPMQIMTATIWFLAGCLIIVLRVLCVREWNAKANVECESGRKKGVKAEPEVKRVGVLRLM